MKKTKKIPKKEESVCCDVEVQECEPCSFEDSVAVEGDNVKGE
jgi:hypothetical protein